MIQISEFKYCNKKPIGTPSIFSEVLANVLAIAMDVKYEDVCRYFYKMSQKSAYRPYDPQTRELVLGSLGTRVKDIPAVQSNYRIAYVCYTTKLAYVLRPRNGTYTAYGLSDPRKYIPQKVWELDCITAREILMNSLLTEENTSSTGNTETTFGTAINEYFYLYNPNPNALNIGDCVLRAISASLKTDWKSSVEKLSASLNGELKFNYSNNFLNVLLDAGFGRVPIEKVNGKYPTGKQLCDWLREKHPDTEAAFAYVGKTHVAAVLPDYEDGFLRFRYHDSWDSTDRRVIDLYLKEKAPENESLVETNTTPLTASMLKPDAQLCHPQFGLGTVLKIIEFGTDSIVTVQFNDLTKNLTGSWVLEHCTSV